MATKLKHTYAVHVTTKLGFGMQPTKGNTAKHARERFKKRFPKQRILDVTRIDPNYKTLSEPI